MNPGSYVSCASGLPRNGDATRLIEMAEDAGYEPWFVRYEGKPDVTWFVHTERYIGMADVICIRKMYTAFEWNGLTAVFKMALAKGE